MRSVFYPAWSSGSYPFDDPAQASRQLEFSHLDYVLDGKNQISCLFVDLAWVYMFKVGWTQKTLNY